MTACCSFIHPESSCLCVAWDLMCTRHELTGMPRKTLRVIGPVWRSFKSFKKKQDSHHPSLTGTSAQQTQTNHKKRKENQPTMDFCFATFSAVFLLFAAASCAPAGHSLQDACADVRSSSMELNHIAKRISVEVSFCLFFIFYY